MIAVSSTVKTDCNSPRLQYKEFITVDSNTVEIKGKMSNSCYNEGNIFGTFIMKKLEFTTENDIGYKGKEVEYYKSVNGESFKIGTYIVTEIKDNDSDETVTVTALDYGLKTAIPYVSSLDYASGTVTLFDVLTEACSNAGLTLKNTSITNGDFIVDSNQFTNNELIGDVIKAVAHISGNFATINENDKVELIYEEETDEIIEDYTELADKRDTLPITSVSLGLSQVSGQEAILRDEEMIAEYGEHWLILNDNPFAYTLEKRQELVTAVFNKVKGFSYSSFESSYSFKPYLQLGDKIQFRNKAGELINSRVLKIDTDYDDIKLSAPSIIKATVDYKNSPDAYEVAKRAEIVANQATSTISLVVSEQTSQGSRFTSIEQDIDYVSINLQKAGGLNLIPNSSLRLGLDKNVTTTGIITIEQYKEIIDNTISNSAIKINTGSIQFDTIKIKENENHTYSCIIYKKELANVIVTITSSKVEVYNITCEPEKFIEFEFPINSSLGQVDIKMECDNNFALFSDCMLNKGAKLSYQTYAGELISANSVMSADGWELTNSNSKSKLILNSEQTAILNSETNEEMVDFNGYDTKLTKATIKDSFCIGKLRHTKVENGHVIVTFDK